MVSNEDFYRREEDRKWRQLVDHQQITLMTGHQVLDRRLNEIEEMVKEVDTILRGDPTSDMDGLITQIHQMQTSIARLNAVLFVDSTGKRGLQHEVEFLLSGEHRAEYRWKFWTSVAVAIISLVGLLATNWNRIADYMQRPSSDPVKRMIEDAKGPKVIHRHYRVNLTDE